MKTRTTYLLPGWDIFAAPGGFPSRHLLAEFGRIVSFSRSKGGQGVKWAKEASDVGRAESHLFWSLLSCKNGQVPHRRKRFRHRAK